MTLERQRQIVEEHVRDASRAARARSPAARRPEGPGFFYPPTVLADVDHEMAVMREETFGPVLPVMAVDSLERGDPAAPTTPPTASRPAAGRAARRRRAGCSASCVAGVVTINDHASSFGEPTAPWGGVKWSGIGRTHGLLGLREMVQPKYVSADRGRGAGTVVVPVRRAEFAALMRQAAPALYSTRPRPPRRGASCGSPASAGCGAASAPARLAAQPRQALLSPWSRPRQLSRSRRPKWHYVAMGVGLIVVAVALTVAWQILAAPQAEPRAR